MKERGILFKDEMVRAILDGKKTQTRRIVKGQRECAGHDVFGFHLGGLAEWIANSFAVRFNWRERLTCPYGVAGDRLWVREAWRVVELDAPHGTLGLDGVRFRADDAFVKIENTQAAAEAWIEAYDNGKHGDHWRPSIFMPRWASRITLEIVEVRVQRLHDITQEDAEAEGITCTTAPPIPTYAHLWGRINGEGAWAANPWVWAITFKRVTP